MIAVPQQQAHVVTLTQAAPKAGYIVFDIETGDPPDDAIQAAISGWKAPSNWKPETVEKNRAKAAEKIQTNGALLDAAPIICAGFKTASGGTMFNGMGDPGALDVPGWSIVNCDSERDMLIAVKAWLDATASAETWIVGHNSTNFDAPKLRNAFVRHRLPLPLCLRPLEPFQPMWDTMRKFRFYSSQHADELYVTLDVVATAFQLPRPKANVSGAEVPGMHRDGRYAEILVYCCIDIETTEQVYLAMTA